MPVALLDTDILSEVLKRKNANVARRAAKYLAHHRQFAFSAITLYEVLRGLIDAELSAAGRRVAVLADSLGQ